jgi:hypothetical protein
MGNPVTIAEDVDEQGRLAEVYGRLRLKLLDLSKKNRMLNYNLGSRSKRHLQIVDEVMDEIYKKLVGDDATLRIEPLDEPEDVPPEEKTEEFIGALEHAKVSHLEYAGKRDFVKNTETVSRFAQMRFRLWLKVALCLFARSGRQMRWLAAAITDDRTQVELRTLLPNTLSTRPEIEGAEIESDQ